jgi:hypothetical protein
MRQDFLGKHDYKLQGSLGTSTTGTGTGTSGWLDLGEFAEQVDIILDIATIATNNKAVLLAYQSTNLTGSGSTSLTIDDGDGEIIAAGNAKAGQFKSRLQTQFDATGSYPWLGCVDGRFIMILYSVTGTNTTGTSVVGGAVLTIASKEYPVE